MSIDILKVYGSDVASVILSHKNISLGYDDIACDNIKSLHS